MNRILFSLAFLLLTSCAAPSVQARSFYTSRKTLASYVVDTPDPEKTRGQGERIWITWHAPSPDEYTHLHTVIRFKDGSEREESFPISSYMGEKYLEITPQDFERTGGLLSYKIELCQKDTILAVSKHKLWVEKIVVTGS